MMKVTNAIIDECNAKNCRLKIGLYYVDSAGRIIQDRETLRIEAPDDGSELTRVSYKLRIGSYKNFDISSNKKYATKKASLIGEDITDFIIDLEIPEPVYITYTISEDNLLYLADNHCELFINDLPVLVNDILTEGDSVKIVSSEKYKLVSAAFMEEGGLTYFEYVNDHEQESVFVNDGYLDFWNAMVGFKVEVEYIREDFDIVGANNIYLIDEVIYKQLMGESLRLGGQVTSARDYSSFMVNALMLPIALPVELIGGEEAIKLADHVTSVNAPLINRDLIEFDLGTIKVIPKKNNLLDYKGVIAKLHLPFSESIDLDINQVIGETLSIKFLVNVYNGTSNISVYSSRTNDIISHTSVQIGLDVPLANVVNVGLELQGKVRASLENGLTKAYVELITPDFDLIDGEHAALIDVDDVLNEVGFVKVDEIELKSMALTSEKEEILNTLKNGVYIK